MFRSLRGRLWASYALMVASALGIAALFLLVYLLRNPLLYRQTQERLRAAETVVRLADAAGEREAPRRLEEAAAMFDVRIVVFSAERAALRDTAPVSPALPFPRPGLFNRVARTIRDANGRSWLYLLQKQGDGTWLMVAAPRPRVSIVALFADDLLPLFAVGGLIALVLSLGTSYLLARWIAEPLQQLVAAAGASPPRAVETAPGSGPPEVRELARAFNAMLKRMQASQQAQRNLIADVSHELKTPLTSIQGFSQAILDHTADSAESRRQAAQVIHDEALRMQHLVTDLLELARLESGTAEMARAEVDLSAVLRAVVERLGPQTATSGIRLELTGADVPLVVTGDSERLLQVFSNLVENAVKYTDAGGDVRVAASADRRGVEVAISDTGKGISEPDLPRIFDRFFQADRSRQRTGKGGAGLGLAIAKEIVQAHDGRISVRSQPGQGTTITVQLPVG